jgi:DNA invertase Pin-like site-specific DNA recombinase
MSDFPHREALPEQPQSAVRKIRKGSALSDRLRQEAVALFEQGFGYKACAGTLGISVYTARDWLHEYRSGRLVSLAKAAVSGQGKRKEPAPGDQARARRLRDEGRSYNEIACVLGLSRTTVRSWLQDGKERDAEGPKTDGPVQMRLF